MSEQITEYFSGDIIDESNFDQYFHDIRTCKPQQGEVIACYSSKAYLVSGNEKRNIIDLLLNTNNKMLAAIQVMRKLFFVSEADAYRILREMAEDLYNGMTVNECLDKEYGYTAEIYYYTKPEYIPKGDPHWTTISILNLDEVFDRKDGSIRSRVVPEKELSDAEVAKTAKLRTAETSGDAI
jgi:hypothetical protein